MEKWMLLMIIYGLLSGINFLFQKKAMEKNHSIEVLVLHITLAFFLVFIDIRNVYVIDSYSLCLIALKALVLFISWVMAFKAISKLNVSTYGVINMSRILFTTLLGILVLNEVLCRNHLIGMLIIILGLILVNLNKSDKKRNNKKYVTVLFVSCFFASIGGLLDKVITMRVSPVQLQWWFLLFMFIYSWIYVFFAKKKINFKIAVKNYYIYILSFSYVIADRILFVANSIPDSKISVISLLKQISVVITVVVGGNLFKEKNLKYKFLCSLIVLLGIIIILFY